MVCYKLKYTDIHISRSGNARQIYIFAIWLFTNTLAYSREKEEILVKRKIKIAI